MTAERYIIKSGPSANRFWDSAKYTFDRNDARIPVLLVVSVGDTHMTISFRVLGVQHEDGSGQSLIIQGTSSSIESGKHLKGYYRADSFSGQPKGWLEVEH